MILAYVDNCGTQIPCERLCPRVDLCECYHCGLIIDFAWVHLLITYLHAIDDQGHLSFCLLHNWANFVSSSFLVQTLWIFFEPHSLNLEHSEDIDYLTLSLREQMIVSHEYGLSLGELLLIQGSMRKIVKFLVQFKKKKNWCKQVGNWFHWFNREGRKILSWFD